MGGLLLALLAFLLPLVLLRPSPYGWDFDMSFTALKTLQGQGLREVWEGVGTGDAHPPGYYLLYKVWMGLGGYDPLPRGVPDGAVQWAFLLNLLGFGFMAAAVALAGWSLLGPWAGVSALGLLFFFGDAPHAYLLRMYPFAGGLVVLSAWAYLSQRPLLGSVLGVVGLYTHYLAGVAVAPFALLALWEGWRVRGARVLLAYLPYLLFLPWVPMLAYQLQRGYHFPDIRPSPEHLFLYVWNKWPKEVFYLFLPLALYASWKEARAKRQVLATVASLYLWFYVSLAVNVVLVRYVFLFAGLVPLALATGIMAVPSWGRWGVAAVVALAGSLNLYYQRTAPPWEDITSQARVAQPFLGDGGFVALYVDGRSRVEPFRLHLPQPEKARELEWSEARELCDAKVPFLLWRYWNRPREESPVQHLLECLGGRAHLLYPTPVGNLYLYRPTSTPVQLPGSATGTPSPGR